MAGRNEAGWYQHNGPFSSSCLAPAGATSANRNPKDNTDAAEEALAELHDEELFKDPPPRDDCPMHVTATSSNATFPLHLAADKSFATAAAATPLS